MSLFSPLNRFRRIRWKLTFSYMAASVIGVFAVELVLIGFLGYVLFSPGFLPRRIVEDITAKAGRVGRALDNKAAPLLLLLSREFESGSGENGSITVGLFMYGKDRSEVVVADPRGNIIAGLPEKKWKSGRSLWSELGARDKALVRRALAGHDPGPADVVIQGTRVACAAPVRDSSGTLRGVLFARGDRLVDPGRFAGGMLNFIAVTLVACALFAGVIGVFFGALSSRGLTRRLLAVDRAAQAWSRGDFSGGIEDRGRDELGELARRLDTMAEALRNLMLVRQRLAASEERNRIARDLHDTVKQQIFAAALQTAAVRVRSGREGAPHGPELEQVEATLIRAQNALTDIIRELAPRDQEWQPLGQSLDELAAEWHMRSGLAVHVSAAVNPEPDPLMARTLYLAASEALTNAARHSRASRVSITLAPDPPGFLTLTVQDDGPGLDKAPLESAGHGLRIMRERIQALPGGVLEVRTAPGQGFRITARVFRGLENHDNESKGNACPGEQAHDQSGH